MRADTIDGGPLGKNVCYANCTHIMVSLLKSWKVTVVGIERYIATSHYGESSEILEGHHGCDRAQHCRF